MTTATDNVVVIRTDLPLWAITFVYFSDEHNDYRPLTVHVHAETDRDAVLSVHNLFGDDVAGGYQVRVNGAKRNLATYDVNDDGKVVPWI